MKDDIFLSIIIPLYNEKSNLERNVLSDIAKYIDSQEYKSEVLIVDDGSNDGSQDFVRSFIETHPNFKLIQIQHGGKAVALLNGIEKAAGKIILMTDMDQSTPIEEFDKLNPYFDKNYDVVIGSRGTKRENTSPLRMIASFGFSTFRRILILHTLKDTQCGFKAFKNTDTIRNLFEKLDAVKVRTATGWKVTAFDVEFLYMIRQKNLQVKEVQINWRNEDVSTTKQRKFVKESFDMFKQIMTVYINKYRGKYS